MHGQLNIKKVFHNIMSYTDDFLQNFTNVCHWCRVLCRFGVDWIVLVVNDTGVHRWFC